jgi:uncharacterized protein (TIRG00374 family)
VANSIAAITLDKLLEMLINLAVLVVGVMALILLRAELDPWLAWQLGLYSVLLLAIPCALLIALWRGYHPLTALLAWMGKVLRRPLWQSSWAQTLHQSETQTIWLCQAHPRVVGMAFLVTLITWVGVIGEFWLLTQMLGLSLSPLQITTSLVAARIAILLPVPAGLGALEIGQVLAMESLGLDPSLGLAIAVVVRGRDVVSGLVGLALGGAHIWQRAGIPTNAMPADAWSASAPEMTPTAAQQSVSPP